MHFRRYLWLPGWRATGTSYPQACARDGISVTPSSYMLHVEGSCISWGFWRKRLLKRNFNKWLKASGTSFFAGSSTRTSYTRWQQLRRQRLLNPFRFWGRVFKRKLSHVHDKSLEQPREGQIQSLYCLYLPNNLLYRWFLYYGCDLRISSKPIMIYSQFQIWFVFSGCTLTAKKALQDQV